MTSITRFIAATVWWCCLLAGCRGGASVPAPAATPPATPTAFAPPSVQREIADLAALPQDCTAYLDPATKDLPLLTPQQHKARCEEFRQKFFAPWRLSGQPRVDDGHVRRAFAASPAKRGFGHNGQPLSQAFYEKLTQIADLNSFPNRRLPAIALRNASIRQLPTSLPRFDDFHSEADGYPFDTFQESAIWAGTPLMICHATNDRSWFYVRAPFTEGWVNAQDVADLSDIDQGNWSARELVAVIQDDVAMTDIGGTGVIRFKAHIGAIFPFEKADDEGLIVRIPIANTRGQAIMVQARIPAGKAVKFGVTPTPAAIAAVANRMIGQPYGWGGMYEARDCSSTMRDIFVPFGIWLPRNSAEQAQGGRVVNLKGLSGEQKERRIIQQGVPLVTLIACPGHIMLYAGQHDGRPVILHNFWGIHVVRGGGPEGRNIVGRCSITTLQPGIELPDIVKPNGDLLGRINAMTLLLPQ